MQIISDKDVFDAYGHWNTLVAKSPNGNTLDWKPAHDGDFFPESSIDYVEYLQKIQFQIINNTKWPVTPIRVDIDINQACKANCLFCFSRLYQNQTYKNALVDSAILDSLFAELSEFGTKTVRLCGGGDCLVHPEIKKILPLAHKYGLRFCIITCGDYLEPDIVDQIIENVDHFRWSINALSDQTRIRIHRPQPGAKRLSEIFDLVRSLVQKRRILRQGKRIPMIWATYLILPENMDEIIPAGRLLKEIGVDSLSFRPVYHGLGGKWTHSQLEKLNRILKEVHKLSEPPIYQIFTPKRKIANSLIIIPKEHFKFCISSSVRTVLEATSDGLMLQKCGIYRGTGSCSDRIINEKNSFMEVWQKSRLGNIDRPLNCNRCIDISINKTLNFIWNILYKEPKAQFYRALVTTD